jgi:hypothetical protein
MSGCDRKQIEVHDTVSPDGKITLRVEIDETGGAAVSDVTSAYLFLSDEGAARKQLALKGSAMSNFSVVWRDPRLVAVSYSAGYVSLCNGTPMLSAEIKINVVGCR